MLRSVILDEQAIFEILLNTIFTQFDSNILVLAKNLDEICRLLPNLSIFDQENARWGLVEPFSIASDHLSDGIFGQNFDELDTDLFSYINENFCDGNTLLMSGRQKVCMEEEYVENCRFFEIISPSYKWELEDARPQATFF
uniref:Uncharacterized protein n=1 Tax=Romanomermis culicivorax TaxID=13658 RepID=A0A915HYB3_ROMCU